MRFILDEHIAMPVVRFLDYLYGRDGVSFIHVRDLGDAYRRGRDQWMIDACDEHDIIVTGDRDQSTRVTDREIARAGRRMLSLGSWFGNQGIRPRALWFVRHADTLIAHGKALQPGMIWRLDRSGKKSVVYNERPSP